MSNTRISGFKQAHRLIAVLALLILLFFGGTIRVLAYGVTYNMDTLAILKSAAAPDSNRFNLQAWSQTERFAIYQELFPCAVGSFNTWLAIQASQPQSALTSFVAFSCVRDRYIFPDINWKLSNRLLTGGNQGWSGQRQIAVYTMFLNALYEQKSGELDKALTWFYKGLVMAPGRIPDYVRQNYYITLAEWYDQQSDDLQTQRLSAKVFCLIHADEACLNSLPLDDLEEWPIPQENSFINEDGWQLTTLLIDREVLAFGLEVRGRLIWQRKEQGELERIVQDFLVPNLAPNAGFEIGALFEDNCVAGYVSSHLYILPCVSHTRPDPYGVFPDQVAIIETKDKGFALTSSTFSIKAGSNYVAGGQLCADGGADALVGRDLINVAPDGKIEAVSVAWFFSQKTQDSTSCWQQHLFFVEPSAEVEEFRLRLQSAASSIESAGHVMFEDIFFFEIPSVETK